MVHDTASARKRVFPLVQAVVLALWRSRISGESQKDDLEMSSSSTSWLPKNTLHILSGDSEEGVLVLEHKAFIAAMAASHRAAPCEGQVLATLQSCLWEREKEGKGVKREEEVVSAILSGQGEKEKKRKGVVVLEEQLNNLYSEVYTATVSSPPQKEKRRKTVVVVLGSDVHSRAAHICMLQHQPITTAWCQPSRPPSDRCRL